MDYNAISWITSLEGFKPGNLWYKLLSNPDASLLLFRKNVGSCYSLQVPQRVYTIYVFTESDKQKTQPYFTAKNI